MPPRDIDSPLSRLLAGYLDPDWYRIRYPDIGALDPYLHFVRYGVTERRDPNRFFDSAWYIEHYPDVAASGLDPLTHYAQAGAAELRNPHPRFDAVYYAGQHPNAAANPLLYHLRIGMARDFATEKTMNITDYLPSANIVSIGTQTGVLPNFACWRLDLSGLDDQIGKICFLSKVVLVPIHPAASSS